MKVVFLPSSELPGRISEGAAADRIVTSPETINDLVMAGKVVAGTRVDFMRSGVGVAVRAGVPRPDVSMVDGFKNALLAAKSVGISQGPSGVYLMGLIERLGIADAIKPKAVFTKPGIAFLGPLPPPLQTTIVYTMAGPSNAKELAASNTLVKFLSSSAVAPIVRKMGLDPA